MDDDLRNRFRKPSGNGMPLPPRPLSRPTPPPPPPQPAPSPQPTAFKPPEKPVARETIIPERRAKQPKRQRSGKKKILIILLVLLLGAGAAGYGFYKQRQNKANQTARTITKAAQSPDLKPTGTIRLIASGDNFTFDSVNSAAKKPDGSYDYSPLFAKVKPFFDKADVKFCTESIPTGGTISGISGFPNFNAPPAFAKGLGDLGCNVINMGTFHMNDKGQPAIDATASYWDKQPGLLAAAGANRSADEQSKIRYFTTKSVKFAFISYATSVNNAQVSPFGVNLYTDDLASKQVQEARKNAQFVIVGMNWGTENSSNIDANQDHISQVLADLNADVIIGVGPHVLQPAKVLSSQDKKHQTLAWFSLGNFLNTQVPVDNLIGGIAVMNIDIATQNIKDPAFLPVYMHYEWTAEQKKRQSAPDLQARHDLMLYPLDQAADPLARSQNGTTVQAQTERVKGIMTKFAPIKIITSAEF